MSMTMDCQLQPVDIQTNDVGMDFGWHSDTYSTLVGDSESALDFANTGKQYMPSGLDEKLNFPNTSSPFTSLQAFAPNYAPLPDAMDPTTLWPASMDNPGMPISQQQQPIQPAMPTNNHLPTTQTPPLNSSLFPIAARRHPSIPHRSSSAKISTLPSDGRSSSAHPSPASSMTSHTPSISTTPTSPAIKSESDKTLRARHAANQRHSKTRRARKDSALLSTASDLDSRASERKQRHREKNKVAAAKCRSRQRKQVQTIQEKGARLGERNAELKQMVQELRRELNELRAMALDHQACGCAVARYNHGQAERVVAEYRNSCMGQGAYGGFGGLEMQQQVGMGVEQQQRSEMAAAQ